MNLIEKLADLIGFHRSYTDSYGNQVHANESARHNLLIAMGYDLSNDDTINASIISLQEDT